MKLDKSAVGKEPMLFGKKKHAERMETYGYMRRIGGISMIQIGEDEFRTPTRRERRSRRIKHKQPHPLAALAQSRRSR
jgi:hypothetical protein